MTAVRSARRLVGAADRLWPVVVGGGALAVVLGASGDHGPVLCPFRLCTGGYCPGCGLTRATGRLLRGDVVGSWHLHPFLLLALAQAALVATARMALGASSLRWARLAGHRDHLLVANLALLLGLWALRLALGDIPAPFA